MQGQGIDPRQQLGQGQAVIPRRPAGQGAEQHLHAEGLGQAAHGAAQFAVAEQAEGLALQLDYGEVQQAELARRLPAVMAHGVAVVGEACGQVEQQHQGVLGHGRGAVALAVAHGHAMGAGGGEVDVVGAGGADQDQLQFRQGGNGGSVDQHLVADGNLCAPQAFQHIPVAGLVVQCEFAENLAQRTQVEVPEVEGGMVEEDGAGAVRHQLYLFSESIEGVRLSA
ncbi:hypothetical protein D9M68_419920 [compost metagenome]